MQNLANVKRPQTSNDLNENVPDFFFFNVGFTLLISANFLVNISVISVLHYKAQTLRALIYEGLFVTDYIGFVDRGEDANFVECVLPLFLSQIEHFNLF